MKFLMTLLMLTSFAVSAKTIDVSKKKINWKGTKVVGKSHSGDITISKGEFTLDKNNMIVKGHAIVDMKTINTTDMKGKDKKDLDAHLKNADFFDVPNHAEAKIKVKKVEKKSKTEMLITTDLTIKNVTQEVKLTANLDKGMLKGKLVFDRTKFGVKYASKNYFKLAADRIINNDIELTFSFKL